MWRRRISTALVGYLLTSCLGGMAVAQSSSAVAEVEAKLKQLSTWLATSDQAAGWHRYLLTEELKPQLAAGMHADPVVVAKVLSRYAGSSFGLDRRRFVEVREALQRWLSELPAASLDQIYAAIDAAKSAFVPLTEADLQDARQSLLRAVGQLDSRLTAAGLSGEGWRSFLGWDGLQEQLAKAAPEASALDAIHVRFDSGQHGLNWQMFVDVRDALRHYLITARAIDNTQLSKQYPQVLDLLGKYLRAYNENPSPQDAQRVSDALRWLQEAHQAGGLVEVVRRRFATPNLYAEVSPAVVAAIIGRTVDETRPVDDCILGTSIHGTGHTTGKVNVELVPSSSRGIIDMLMVAATSSDTIGRNRQVRIYNTGITQHASRKRLVLTESGLSGEPAATNAVTSSQIKCIQANRDLIERIASRKASQQQAQANEIASDHAEQRINNQMDEQAARQIASTNEQFEKQFRRPLERFGLFPRILTFSTTPDALGAVALEAGSTNLAAPSAPPSLDVRGDVAMRVHESAVNNFAQRLLGGMIVEETQLQKDITDLLGYLPEQLKNTEESSEPLAITFAKQQPISVAFGKDSFTITIRGTAYTKAGTDYPGMNVTVAYDLKQTDQGPRAVRRGGLEVFPPGFAPDSGRQLSTREQVLRRILQRRFDSVFSQEIVPKPITPKDQLSKLGTLLVQQWRSADGWMVVGWHRDQSSPTTGAAPAAARP